MHTKTHLHIHKDAARTVAEVANEGLTGLKAIMSDPQEVEQVAREAVTQLTTALSIIYLTPSGKLEDKLIRVATISRLQGWPQKLGGADSMVPVGLINILESAISDPTTVTENEYQLAKNYLCGFIFLATEEEIRIDQKLKDSAKEPPKARD